MNYIKYIRIIFITALLCMVYCGHAQQNNNNPFIGTWKNQTGNKVFIVTIWQESGGIVKGHYKMITVNSTGQQTGVVYNSDKELGTSGQNWPHVLYAGTYQNDYVIGGNVRDNTVNNQRGFIEGQFKMTTVVCIAPNCTQTATWSVKKDQGLREPGEPEFNIPTNLTLTKVQ